MPKIDTANDQSLFKLNWKDLTYKVDLNKNNLLSASRNRNLIENLNGEFISSSLVGKVRF